LANHIAAVVARNKRKKDETEDFLHDLV
jgi:hypothetical protein